MNDPTEVREPLVEAGANTTLPTDAAFKLDRSESAGLQDDLWVDTSSTQQPAMRVPTKDANPEQVTAIVGSEVGFPPSEELAQLHARCHRYGAKKTAPTSTGAKTQASRCNCCQFFEASVLPINTPSVDLLTYGVTIPLSFDIWKFVFVVFGLASMFSAYLVYEIVDANCRLSVDPHNLKPYPCGVFSLGMYININARQEERFYADRNRYGVLSTLLFYVLYKVYKSREKKMIRKLKEQVHLLSDHTVMVWNLYPDEATPEYVRQVLQRRYDGVLPEPVSYNFTSRGRSRYCATQEVLNDIDEKIGVFQASLDSGRFSGSTDKLLSARLKSLARERKQQLQKSRSLEKTLERSAAHAEGVALVTFESRSTQERIRRVGVLSRFFYHLCGCCYKHKVHYVTSAYEPDDIRWDKIGFTKTKIWATAVWWYLVFIVGFVIAFYANLIFISECLSAKRIILEDARKKNLQLGLLNMAQVYGFLIPMGGAAIDSFLGMLIEFIARRKMTISLSEVLSESIIRQSEIEFAMVSALYNMTHYSMEAPTDYTILSEMVFNYFLFNIVKTPVALAAPWLLSRFKQWRVGCKLRQWQTGQTDDPGEVLTQKELNQIFENPKMDLAKRYSPFFKTIFLAAYYLELVPTCALLTLVYLIVQYWADKYMILRVYSPPIRLNELFCIEMTNNMRRMLTYLSLDSIILALDINQSDRAAYANGKKPPYSGNLSFPPPEYYLPSTMLFLFLTVFWRGLVVMVFQGVDLVIDTLCSICSCGTSKERPVPSSDFDSSQANPASSFFGDESEPKIFMLEQKFDVTYEQFNPMSKNEARNSLGA